MYKKSKDIYENENITAKKLNSGKLENEENKKVTEYKESINGFELDENLIKEAESIWAEVQSDESLRDVKAPSDLRENVFKAIREQDEQRARMNLSDADKELLQLGRIYKKRRKGRKYLVLVAAAVAMLALGITSVGEGEKIFGQMIRWVGGREQNHVDSDNVVPITKITEEDAYQQIEDEYGVLPVRMTYYPDGIALQEVLYGDEVQGISMYYGTKDAISVIYIARPDYRNGSWGQDVEDELIDEYELDAEGNVIQIQKYLIEGKILKWSIRFSYNDISYFITVRGYGQDEVEKIVQNLFFYK